MRRPDPFAQTKAPRKPAPADARSGPLRATWRALSRRWKAQQVDRTGLGFDAAIAAAVAHVEQYCWASLAEAADELALTVGEKLNQPDVGARFVALHANSGKTRFYVWAGNWEDRVDLVIRVNGEGAKRG